GVMLYEMITGDVHSRGASDAQLIIQAQTGHFEPIGRMVRDLPLGLELAVMKSLAPDRENRFPSARTFRNALDTIVQREGLEVAPEAVASYLSSLFPDPFSKGSRVDEVEQLSARDIQEFSGEMAAQSSGGYAPVSKPPPPGRTPSGGYQGNNQPPPAQYNYYNDPGPPPAMAVDLPPPPGAAPQQYDFFGRSQVAPSSQPPPQQQPLEATKTARPQVAFEEVEANPVGLTKATSESGRERRRRLRLEQKAEQQKKEEALEKAIVQKDFAAIPPKPRDPWVGPFIERLGKALGHTFVNILFLIALIAIGVGIFKYTRNSEEQDKKANQAVNTPLKGKKRCTRGLVYISIKTQPAGADIYFEGTATGVKSPVSNVEYNMCFNEPLIIRAEKGILAGEASLNYPLKGKNVSVSIKLVKDFKKGSAPIAPVISGNDSGSYQGGSGHGGSTMRPQGKSSSPTEKVKIPDAAKPVGGSTDAPEVAGGIGILKVSCSQPCSPIVEGRSKGKTLSFRLRARKAPYNVKVKFNDGTFSPSKKVYIQPYQDNFVRFSK
ncbi:hypothetical protein KKF84_20095, partial [Myxococcota bacterium]|nr:hypothetical protein [Myxococcota bacterium]MBU1537627.1 hypothetical protein [Myxococcota bacterium]